MHSKTVQSATLPHSPTRCYVTLMTGLPGSKDSLGTVLSGLTELQIPATVTTLVYYKLNYTHISCPTKTQSYKLLIACDGFGTLKIVGMAFQTRRCFMLLKNWFGSKCRSQRRQFFFKYSVVACRKSARPQFCSQRLLLPQNNAERINTTHLPHMVCT